MLPLPSRPQAILRFIRLRTEARGLRPLRGKRTSDGADRDATGLEPR